MSFNIEIQGGSSVRLPIAGKYCDRDIVITTTIGGGGDSNFDGIIDRTISGKVSSNAESVGDYAFHKCTELEGIDLPFATVVGEYAFRSNSALEYINAPLITSLGESAMETCGKLKKVVFPHLETIGTYCFYNCVRLEYADFPKLTRLVGRAIQNCYSIKTMVLRSPTLCTLTIANAFTGCYHILGTRHSVYNPQGSKDGYFYVPRDLKSDYESATNWSQYSTQFRAIEDYTIDGTVTGELDPTKI